MKELKTKLNELEEGLVNINFTMKSIEEEIDNCKKMKTDYLSYEMIYNKCKESRKEILNKIDIIYNAIDILEGVK